MKTTDQDPKPNQKESTSELDQKLEQPNVVDALPQNANLDNQYASKQLDLPLMVTDSLAMVSGTYDEAKKRKSKKEDTEQNTNDEKVLD